MGDLLQRFVVSFAGANPHRLLDGIHEDFPIADLACLGGTHDGVDCGLQLPLGDDYERAFVHATAANNVGPTGIHDAERGSRWAAARRRPD